MNPEELAGALFGTFFRSGWVGLVLITMVVILVGIVGGMAFWKSKFPASTFSNLIARAQTFKIITIIVLVASSTMLVFYIILNTFNGVDNFFSSWGSKNRPLPTAVIEMARAGISRNADWQPITRRLDDLDLVLVPAGCFTMGSTAQQLSEATNSCERFFGSGKCKVDFVGSETPPHEVCFESPFWIGETEVTNRLYGSSSSTDMETMYRAPDWPRETITWQEASQFCLDHNARLPSEAEWEFSARGPDGLIYPWGNEFDLERLASGRLMPADVGSVPEGASWVGAFDMSGGIAEWVANEYALYSQAVAENPAALKDDQQRVIRGGSWFSFAAFYLRTSHREPADPATTNSTIGFRCARDFD